MANTTMLPRYDRSQTYAWNYQHAPDPVELPPPPQMEGSWKYCGLPAEGPLAVAAGPLLNGRWILYYASLGFDVLTYKTVRSRERDCYPLPNLLPVECGPLDGSQREVPAAHEMQGSWAVSFGMPSRTPEFWQRDVAETRARLAPGKLLAVSVVATPQPDWNLDDLANDYAQCAAMAVESGADLIETNFSCPNVSTCDGQLFQRPQDAGVVAERVRAAIGQTPLAIKIGHVTEREEAEELISALAPSAQALSLTNSVPSHVRLASGELEFAGAQRGICGAATREATLQQTALFAEIINARGLSLEVISVGGISTAQHVREALEHGATAVQIATAAMVEPDIALQIRQQWNDQ